MAKMERIREVVTGPLDLEYMRKRADAGWELLAVEWQRPAAGAETGLGASGDEVPYGSRVADDCEHLEEDPSEMNALMLILELIVQDRSLSNMAETLNQGGFRTRDGSKWSVVTVYKMLPRLIEVSPRIFTRDAWIEHRKRIPTVG
ncbi:MAG: recombinase family protein [Terriglobia bacterium]|jgi:hypothetical protein